MARLNIEDSWWTDTRRYKLIELVGSEAEADGLAVSAWRLSQLFWGNGRKKIPRQEFAKLPKFDLLIQVDLASKHGSFIYVRGSKQYHEWYASLKESAAKGGKSKKKERKRIASGSQADLKSLTLTPSPSLTPTLKEEYIYETRFDSKLKSEQPLLGEAIQEWQNTLDHYKLSRQARSDDIQIARLISRYGIEDVLNALKGFRLEKPFKDYDPSQHVGITRLSNIKAFDRLKNLGSQKQEQLTRRKVQDAIPTSNESNRSSSQGDI